MTCHEFRHSAASLPLWELARVQDEQVLGHASECSNCGAWLQKQRMLTATMQTLQARTAGMEAGPQVERVLLQAFRQRTMVEPVQPVVAPRFTPIAMRLSRFFEVGAYAAVAAAIAISLFLGVRLLQHRALTGSIQSQSAPTNLAPSQPESGTAAKTIAKEVVPVVQEHSSPARKVLARRSLAASTRALQPTNAADQSQASDDPEYVALMFCDPLICSTDAQVVRMEIPAPGAGNEHGAQPQIADVVVGYDGLVRAVRIVN